MELLYFSCKKIKKVFTINSTAALIFQKTADLYWCGSMFSRALKDKYGDLSMPKMAEKITENVE